MLITRQNYEEFFLDYLDGNLNRELESEFNEFLASNPDLKSELDEMKDFQNLSIETDKHIFSNKDDLKKDESENASNFLNDFDKYAIASIEGDLNPDKKLEFDNFLNENTDKKKEYQYYLKSKLSADQSIKYQEKSSLKRVLIFGLSRNKFYTTISIAASIFLILSLFITGGKDNLENSTQYSQHDETPEKTQSSINIPPESSTSVNDELAIDDVKVFEAAELAKKEIKKAEALKKEKRLKEIEKAKKEKLLKSKEVFSPKIKKKKEDPVKPPQVDPKELKKTGTKDKKDNKPEKQDIKKLDPKMVKPPLKKKANPKKRMVKPVEIHSQGLLAQAAETSNDDKKYLNLKQLATRLFKKNVLKQNEEEIDHNKLDIWEIADAGVKSINKITKKDINLIREYNTEGELIAYAFDSPKLSIEKKVRKK